MTSLRSLAVAMALVAGADAVLAPHQAPRGTLVIAVALEAASPVPSLWRNAQANREVSDLLFLHLADPDPAYQLTSERAWQPRLARRWIRRDSLTLAFELDPRARWHDGTPVTAGDVVLGLERGRNAVVAAQTATLLRRIAAVTAESDRVVVVRFRVAYSEQFYDAVFHAPPLPAHLVGTLPAESLATSPFVRDPVGNGPYRFSRRLPGQQLDLVANDDFFLGRPGIGRIVFLVAGDGEARVNLLLAGGADAVDNIYGLPNWQRVERLPDYLYYPLPGLQLNWAPFNFRDPADTTRPHPLFTDPGVRRALTLAVNRERMARVAYGPMTSAPGAPLSALMARGVELPPPLPYDTAQAGRLLAARGWADRDGDGVLDKDGRALRFRLMAPTVAPARIRMAEEMLESWRRLGVDAQIELVDGAVFMERHRAGRFDLDMYGASQDPTPSGLSQSWSCAGIGGSNVSHYCNPRVDTLLARAQVQAANAPRLYRDVARTIADDVPAIVLAAPVSGVAVHRRFTRVQIRAESAWADVWRWTLRSDLALERDRQ